MNDKNFSTPQSYGKQDFIIEEGDSGNAIESVLFRYYGNAEEVEIPDDVSVIGGFAFSGNNKIKSVVIPNSVERILPYAFANCENLEEVIIEGNYLITIDSGAFLLCSKLKTINIPDSVTVIGDSAFAECRSLRELVLPASLQLISEAAFNCCESIRIKNFPKSLKTIQMGAFAGADIDIPDWITVIEEKAFEYSMLSEMFIPKSVKVIGPNVFIGTFLDTIYYEGTEEEWNAIYIDEDNKELKSAKVVFNYIAE